METMETLTPTEAAKALGLIIAQAELNEIRLSPFELDGLKVAYDYLSSIITVTGYTSPDEPGRIRVKLD